VVVSQSLEENLTYKKESHREEDEVEIAEKTG
jgi:hypothetical protein